MTQSYNYTHVEADAPESPPHRAVRAVPTARASFTSVMRGTASLQPGTPQMGCCPILFVSKTLKAHSSLHGPRSSGGLRDVYLVSSVELSCFQRDSTWLGLGLGLGLG